MDHDRYLNRLPTHERRLPNGLTVLVREDHSAPVVAIVTHVRAGYFDEPDRLVGISHVLEHMYFKGTERLGPGEIARATRGAGGFLNAGTIYDYTSYYTVLPSSALETGLEIQADALLNSQIDEDELRRELLVIIQEAKRKLDNPDAVAAETLYELLFDVHRIRRWRIGTEEGLRRLSRQDVWDYYRALYRPANIILAVAGDVDPERTFELIERHYGVMPAGDVVRETSPAEPERTGLRFREMSGDITQTYHAWGWRTPGTLHPDTPALDLLGTILGQGRASRLFREVREAGLVSGIGAYNYTPTEVGVFGISAELPPRDSAAAIQATATVLVALGDHAGGSAHGTAAELDRARNILEARFLRRLETAEGQANLLAQWQALGDWRLAGDYLDRIFAVTTDDLRRVAREYLDLDRATLLVYHPESAEPLGWGVDRLAEVVEAARTGEGGGAAVVAPRVVPEATPAVTTPPRPALELAGAEDGVHFYELPNGVRLALKPRGASPLVAMGIFNRGGALHETADWTGITGLMARVSLKGTRHWSAAGLAEATEALGGSIAPLVGPDLFQWSLTLPSRHFRTGLSLLTEAALRPTFPEGEVDRERKVALSDLEQLRDDMYRFPMRLFLQAAFPNHPYGVTTSAAEESLRALTREDLERWHRTELLEGKPWVVVVGDIDPDDAAAAIAAEFAELRGGPAPAATSGAIWPTGPRTEADHRAKAQTALVLGFPGPDRNHDDTYTLDVLSNILSGLGGRLFEELRSRRSLAYTVSAYPLARYRGGAFISYIATSPGREDEARRGLLEEFERLTTESVTTDELERAREYTIGTWKIRSQTNGAQLADLAYALSLGTGLAELREFEDRIRAVTPVMIRDAAQKYFDPNRAVEGIVRGRAGEGERGEEG
jgi:zinc protease